MRTFLSVVFLFCLLALFLEDVAGHRACYYTSVGLKNATKEEQCSESCSTYESEATGQCFAYLVDSLSGECTGFVFDYSHQKNYTKCGANYAAEPDAADVFDVDAFTDSYYADLANGEEPEDYDTYSDEPEYYDSYHEEDDGTDDDSGCSFRSLTLGIAGTRKTCKRLCTSLENSGSKVYRRCVAWFWNPEDEECAGLVSTSNADGGICGSVEKPR